MNTKIKNIAITKKKLKSIKNKNQLELIFTPKKIPSNKIFLPKKNLFTVKKYFYQKKLVYRQTKYFYQKKTFLPSKKTLLQKKYRQKNIFTKKKLFYRQKNIFQVKNREKQIYPANCICSGGNRPASVKDENAVAATMPQIKLKSLQYLPSSKVIESSSLNLSVF